MLIEYNLKTQKQDFYNITTQVREAVTKSGVTDGIAVVFCPHTTAGVTINENADPDVVRDLLFSLDKTFPDHPEFHHAEGNSAAHMKASTVGSSVTVIVDGGKLVLGTWQGIYFCEFDPGRLGEQRSDFCSATSPPRSRKFYVKIIGNRDE